MSKDKKLTKAVSACTDSFFGKVVSLEHVLEADVLPLLVDDKKSKNSLARASSLEFLERCIKRNEDAGPRGALTMSTISNAGHLAIAKLGDPDAGVRNAAIKVLQALKALSDESIVIKVEAMIESLKSTNARAYKTLTKESATLRPSHSSIPNQVGTPSKEFKGEACSLPSSGTEQKPTTTESTKPLPAVAEVQEIPSQGKSSLPTRTDEPQLTEALSIVSNFQIPLWNAPEDDGGVLAGLVSTKWVRKQSAIRSIVAFIQSEMKHLPMDGISDKTSALLQTVKAHTKGFKESNVNVMKAILQLFSATCEFHFSIEIVLPEWIAEDGLSTAIQKISDKKLVDLCKDVMTNTCTVLDPSRALRICSTTIQTVRSPVAHEEFLKWSRGFCESFGSAAVLPALPDFGAALISDVIASNPKVKREASTTMAELYRYLGPRFRAMLLSQATTSQAKDEVDKCLQNAEFDASLLQKEPAKQTIASGSDQTNGGPGSSVESIALPKFDLISALPDDVVQKLNAKEGKTAWKLRKEALDAVEDAIKSCTGVIDSSSTKQFVDLIRALRGRLSDTQMNLKPLAARSIGKILGNIDSSAQAKLGKIVYAPLINAAMNDIKKPMRDASLESLNQIIRSPDIDGGKVNRETLDGFVSALASEINETAVKSVGLSLLLDFLMSLVDDFPNLDETASSRGETLGEKFAPVLIECLLSTKSETRSASTELVKKYVEKCVCSASTFQRVSERLKPAKQRSVKPFLDDLSRSATASPGKENKPSVQSQQETPARLTNNSSRDERSTIPPRSSTRSQTQASQNGVSVRQAPRALNYSSGNSAVPSPRNKVSVGSHPLLSRTSSKTQHRAIIWPEFPEEPTASSNFGDLKKSWSPFLPQTSILKLFPSSGIKKQDDALAGCQLIRSAVGLDQSRPNSIVIEQLDYILKWLALVLCTREATVGLQALIDVILSLFHFLVEKQRELTDVECLTLIPFIIEKAANAKGRFHENFFDVIHILKNYQLVPAKVLGPSGCVIVFERSTHAKARALAYSLCMECINSAGLVGIGKKGVAAAAKLLSEEHIPENKNAVLGLLESILERMNGDMQRLARVCGPAFDNKSRDLLEERWKKRDERPPSSPPSKTATAVSSASRHPATPETVNGAPVLDELPALSLRDMSSSSKAIQNIPPISTEESTPFMNGIKSQDFVPSDVRGGSSSSGGQMIKNVSPPQVSTTLIGVNKIENKGSSEAEVGTAAGLRARLLKLKEKTIEDFDEAELISETTFKSPDDELNHTLSALQQVFDAPIPITDYDPRMIAASESLKRIHSALSQQQPGGEALRDVILTRLPETLEYLTRVIGFACHCGESSVKAGMSIQLLSVGLATLIALFKDNEIARQVTQDDLMLLIRETATALLDPRLAPGASTELDDATSTQMVRAINKTTISAACGVPRHTSLQALLSIQQQLCLEPSDDAESEAFHRRMSRVITKLFARVIRHEEGLSVPFSQDAVDLEALVCMMEDALVACNQATHENPKADQDTIQVCRDMTRSLVQAIIKAYGDPIHLLNVLDDLGIDSDSSDLGELVNSCAAEGTSRITEAIKSLPASDAHKGPSIGELVSSFVNAKDEEERHTALVALRAYKKDHGAWDLKAHLEQLSPAFRAFLEDQLSAMEDSSPEKQSSESNASMSDRLRSLRSRIAGNESKMKSRDSGATEVLEDTQPAVPLQSVQPSTKETATFKIGAESSTPSVVPLNHTTTGVPSPSLRPTGLTRPSPSKLPPPGSFRERLAATSTGGSPSHASSSRAAALRARLEAMRQNGS
jgi:cytoskeleton-associated protein 5